MEDRHKHALAFVVVANAWCPRENYRQSSRLAPTVTALEPKKVPMLPIRPFGQQAAPVKNQPVYDPYRLAHRSTRKIYGVRATGQIIAAR